MEQPVLARKTAAAVKRKMEAIGADMRMACVYWKPEKNITDLAPDYFVKDVGGDWIVFPHEIEGLSPEEVVRKDKALFELMADCV